jgi:hypothetical protein
MLFVVSQVRVSNAAAQRLAQAVGRRAIEEESVRRERYIYV